MYCEDLINNQRRKTIQVKIGELGLGSDFPIRIQSMTTTDTMDTLASVEQSIRMIEAGCELVRLTAPSINEAKNLKNIKDELRLRGYNTPIVADIHFTPNAAEVAATIVEKVRVNPGNYVDKKKFEELAYTDESYQEELERIKQKFTPLVELCRQHGTAMRIGTNHGSLSDRIMSRYGDSPLGMAESALEFIRICEDNDYRNLVVSMKSSNPQVMVQAYRLLVELMNKEGMNYPLHLGVTEAGEGEDGRIKSAIGIGTLLEDGIGDTIRVSLTEDPEFEAPVAQLLANRYNKPFEKLFTEHSYLQIQGYTPYSYQRRHTHQVLNFGADQVPRVISDLSNCKQITEFELLQLGHLYDAKLDKWHMTDLGVDYIYCGTNPPDFMMPNGLATIINYSVWNSPSSSGFPLFTYEELQSATSKHPELNFLKLHPAELNQNIIEVLKGNPTIVIVFETADERAMKQYRKGYFDLLLAGITNPVINSRAINADKEAFTLFASIDTGALFLDGFGDGIMLSNAEIQLNEINSVAFGILQATRTRISKTEYISCPSCGRTLFDLQKTTAMIRQRTDHLKGIKIAIMGCIVNGPGEMADADFGYVGSGVGKITLYRGKEVVKRGIPSENALDELVQLIKDDGKWNVKN